MLRKGVNAATGRAGDRKAERHRSRQTTMKKLRQSGMALFSKHGFDGASTRMVAQHAGINESLISRYFGGKVGFLDSIILEFAREVDSDSSGYVAGRTVEEELANFLTAGISAAKRHPTFLKLVLSRALLHPKFRKTITRHFHGAGEARLLDRLRDYQRQEIIDRSVDLQETVDILQLFVAGTLFHQLALSAPVISTERAIDVIAKSVACTVKSKK